MAHPARPRQTTALASPPAVRYRPAPLPCDELDRLRSLGSYAIVDTPDEPEYDELTALAADVCQTPLAAVSLLEIGRQWLKASVGVPVREYRRDLSFCSWAILTPSRMLVVPDAQHDVRFARNPAVTDLGLRSYAGVPLVTIDGQPLGTLCVMDTEPRRLSTRQLTALRVLGNQVVAQLELRRSRLEQAQLRHRLSQWEDLVSRASVPTPRPVAVPVPVPVPSTDPELR